ncbi:MULTISPECIES: oxygenase MpaB family protein [unclassified Streptomyces]|uniref:oxygenase MpaB family protein n=1 Tax=unclassified Streptomyces TaxID=2593676 RepID=UPI00093E75AC|nr:oxygenase MpaB family protein [Streptomyces sp. CB02058]OKI87371.1 Latex clearing protein [Streptomyces sp. CB02058]
MTNLNRRSVLSLGVALGLVGVADPAKAWAWASADSVAGAGAGLDPEYIWDSATDPLMASLLKNGQVPAVNTAMASWVNNGDALPSGLPAELAAHLRTVNKLPSWADQTKLTRAADFNRRKDTYLFMLYGLGSGIMSTVIPREARSVYWSFGGADMKDRAAKTFTFGYDLSQLDAFKPTGQFVVTANKTRLVHGAVRTLLPQSPHWKAGADQNIPISVADILVTFHSLGTFVHKKLVDWRVPMSAADEEAFLHSWQVAIYLLGVPEEYIPKTWAAAEAQSAQVLTPILAPTPEGLDLAEVLLGLTAEIDLGVTRGFLNEFVRYVLSNEVGDWLKLPRDYAAAALVRTVWPAFILFREGLSPVMPGTFYMFDQFVRALAMLFLNKGSSSTTTPITIPTGNRPG